jgi:peptidoglycan/LPS O-acetylase OafA/YrhL
LLATPVAATLYFTPNWYMWFGIPTPDHGVIPHASAMIIYGLAFGFGWLINRQPHILEGWGKWWGAYVGPAIGATATCLVIGGVTPSLEPAQQNLTTLGYAALYAFAVWAWTIAIIGFAVRHLSDESPARRYLADASYWIYIVHLPLVMVLQTAFAPYDWPWFAKYPLILSIAVVIMLASYQWFVRYSFIGAILNGKKQKPVKARRVAPQLAAAE